MASKFTQGKLDSLLKSGKVRAVTYTDINELGKYLSSGNVSTGRQVILGQVPSKSNSYVTTKQGGFFKSPVVRDYEKSFNAQCTKYRNAMISQPYELIVDAYYKTKASDIDGCLKVVADILQHKVKAVLNDNLCYRIVATKHIDKDNPRLEFELNVL